MLAEAPPAVAKVGPKRRVLRYRMEVELRRVRQRPKLASEFRLVPWSTRVASVADLIAQHAEAKQAAFRGEGDADLFDCFRTLEGCTELMRRIALRPNFLPRTTWLAERVGPGRDAPGTVVGTIQGLRASPTWGSVQNLGVTAEARGRGVGRALLLRALLGFRESRLTRVALEVTAANEPAIALYRSVGFRITKTTERAVSG